MSSDTDMTTLDDFGVDSTPEDDQTAPDQSHNPKPKPKPKWTPDGGPGCQCGASVSKEVARVFGQAGTVPACATCYDSYDGRSYDTDSRALVHFLGGSDV